MKIFTKESLIAELKAICESGWVKSCREPGNHGAVRSTKAIIEVTKERPVSLD